MEYMVACRGRQLEAFAAGNEGSIHTHKRGEGHLGGKLLEARTWIPEQDGNPRGTVLAASYILRSCVAVCAPSVHHPSWHPDFAKGANSLHEKPLGRVRHALVETNYATRLCHASGRRSGSTLAFEQHMDVCDNLLSKSYFQKIM